MGLNTRLTVGSVIFAIMLLSIFGVNRAFRTLTGSPEEGRIESERVDSFNSDDEVRDRTASQSNDRRSQAARTLNDNGELILTPLQTAGTFIQRQKRIEEDPAVLGTEVSVVAVADGADSNASTTAQPNSITTNQSGTTNSTANTSSRPASAAPATAPAVPALW